MVCLLLRLRQEGFLALLVSIQILSNDKMCIIFRAVNPRFYSTHDADLNRISLGSWGLMSVLDYHQDVRRNDRN